MAGRPVQGGARHMLHDTMPPGASHRQAGRCAVSAADHGCHACSVSPAGQALRASLGCRACPGASTGLRSAEMVTFPTAPPQGGEAPAAFRPSRPPGHSAPRQGARRRNHRHARKSSPTLTETRPPAPPSRAVSAGRSHPAPGRPINPSPRACRRAARQSRLDTPRSASSVRPRMLASCLAKACIRRIFARNLSGPTSRRVTSYRTVAINGSPLACYAYDRRCAVRAAAITQRLSPC